MQGDLAMPAALWAWLMNPSNADLVNGSFELVGAVCCWLNVVIYLQHRRVQGIFWPTTIFYSTWGMWNLIYYSALDQWLSFYAGIAMTSGSCLWVILVVADKLRGRGRRAPDGSRFAPAANIIP